MNELDVIEHRLAAAPGLIPVITNAPNVLRRFRVGQDSADPLVNEVTIVIPDNYFLITRPFPLNRRTEMVFQKISLFVRGINTRFPSLRGHGFVLNSDAPDGNAFPLIGLDSLREVVVLGLIKLRFLSGTVTLIVVVIL